MLGFLGRPRRNLALDFLFVVFGIASWVSINGLWVELPIMVQRMPESWGLASYLAVISQLANLGPISYSVLRYWCKVPMHYVIYALLTVGSVASLALTLFWDETSVVLGVEHSTSLFICVFFLSFVDCTSSVLFMPFMATFMTKYLNSYLIGEGMSGFLPALVALAQGTGGNPYCRNVTKINVTDSGVNITDYVMEAVTPEPNFSIEVFFSLLTSFMVASTIAFVLINNLPVFLKERATSVPLASDADADADADATSTGQPVDDGQYHDIAYVQPGHETTTQTVIPTRRRLFYLYLGIHAFLCFVSNGSLSSIQPYSCLPFGNVVYHWAVILSAMANPTMAFVAFFFPSRRPRAILGYTAIGTVFAGYILATALNSPNMLLGQDVGGTLTVLSWVIYGGLFSYVKISIAGWCRDQSESALFWYGVWTQVGSALGAGSTFLVVNFTSIFQQYYVKC